MEEKDKMKSIEKIKNRSFENFIKNYQRQNYQPLSSEMNNQPFRQTGQMIELCYEYLSIRCI